VKKDRTPVNESNLALHKKRKKKVFSGFERFRTRLGQRVTNRVPKPSWKCTPKKEDWKGVSMTGILAVSANFPIAWWTVCWSRKKRGEGKTRPGVVGGARTGSKSHAQYQRIKKTKSVATQGDIEGWTEFWGRTRNNQTKERG